MKTTARKTVLNKNRAVAATVHNVTVNFDRY